MHMCVKEQSARSQGQLCQPVAVSFICRFHCPVVTVVEAAGVTPVLPATMLPTIMSIRPMAVTPAITVEVVVIGDAVSRCLATVRRTGRQASWLSVVSTATMAALDSVVAADTMATAAEVLTGELRVRAATASRTRRTGITETARSDQLATLVPALHPNLADFTRDLCRLVCVFLNHQDIHRPLLVTLACHLNTEARYFYAC